jgi:16S rRNA A1518/A1519 N6-dimethyltransferase RsmA/KsgA/DIM1 with predicted DNA glycosylase/AP lyase activity
VGARRPRHKHRSGERDGPGRKNRRPDLSQHFIRSDSTARRLVRASSISKHDLVVEAGPGNGALTAHLAAAASHVVGIELDRTLYNRLQQSFRDSANVTLTNADFLSYRLPSRPYVFFSNIPYSRTADIVRKIALGSHPAQDAYLVLEAAAARRFMGQPFGPESALSLALKLRFEPSIVASVDRREFQPPPAVNSVMLRLAGRAQSLVPSSRHRDFDRFARSVFDSPGMSARTRLRNLLTIRQARLLIDELGFPSTSTPSNIGFDHWLTVFKLIEWNREIT